MTKRYEELNLDGTGHRKTAVYDVAPKDVEHDKWPSGKITVRDYWAAVTDVPCPVCSDGTIRWAEAGYVPGYRICDGCGAHFLARGNEDAPTLARMHGRKG